jgi:hypothetical protein
MVDIIRSGWLDHLLKSLASIFNRFQNRVKFLAQVRQLLYYFLRGARLEIQ